MNEVIRMPVVAGAFYDDNPEVLKNKIERFLSEVKTDLIYEKIYGIISPHAGYIYSGRTAAYGYKLLTGKQIDTVVIVSPSHQEYFEGISVYDGDGYQTPLGIVKVNKELREKLIQNEGYIFSSKYGHRREHALEVQLPFLQVVLKDFDIIPLVMGDQSEKYIYALGEALADVLKERNSILVASSDLSHYHSHKTAERLDSIVEKHINNFDYESLIEDLAINKVEACGGGPMAAVMYASKLLGAKKSKVLYRCDSSLVNLDQSQVVGYLSGIIYE